MKKFPKIRRIGDEENAGILDSGEILVQEKLDGANFRFTWDDDQQRLVFGSRNVEWKNERDTANAFTHAVKFVCDHIDRNALHHYLNRNEADYVDEIVFFGEAMHPHTLEYDWDDVPSFIGFDVWDDEFGFWYHPEQAFDELNLPTAPTVYRGPANDFDFNEDYEVPQSEYRNGTAEGVVLKNWETGQRAKIRSPEFLEVHGSSPKNDQSDGGLPDAIVLADRFATEARILKEIHKMRDEGATVEMAMMETLWRRVFDDIIDEEYNEILSGNYNLDTRQFRTSIASTTATVLERYLERPDGSVLNEVPG